MTAIALAAGVIGCLATTAVVAIITHPLDDEWRDRWH